MSLLKVNKHISYTKWLSNIQYQYVYHRLILILIYMHLIIELNANIMIGIASLVG